MICTDHMVRPHTHTVSDSLMNNGHFKYCPLYPSPFPSELGDFGAKESFLYDPSPVDLYVV
jgi:hypothetical protein